MITITHLQGGGAYVISKLVNSQGITCLDVVPWLDISREASCFKLASLRERTKENKQFLAAT